MKYKAIIFDLDRTVLRNDKSISDYTVSVMKKCREKGYFIIAATARPTRGVKLYSEIINFDGTIELNGAIIRYGESEVFYNPISEKSGTEFLKRLISIYNDLKKEKPAIGDIKISVETGENLYCNFDLKEAYPGAVFYSGFPSLPENSRLHKISVGYNFSEIMQLVNKALTDDLYTTVADNKLFQIMSKKASKWNGIKTLINKFEVYPEETIFFGDDNDDIEPILMCGTGAAVENASDNVKAAADIIVGSNENDGVAGYIDKYLL